MKYHIQGRKKEQPSTKDKAALNVILHDCTRTRGFSRYMGIVSPVVLIEQRLDFSRYVEEGFGTGDCVIIADGTLYIIDYKHGKGVEVSAEGNPQMMLYALGALELFDGIYDIDAVRMAIYQPRRENVSVYIKVYENGNISVHFKFADESARLLSTLKSTPPIPPRWVDPRQSMKSP